MRLEPYLCFYGKTIEALDFYATALGGTYVAFRFDESPAGEGVEEAWKHKIIHATFTGDGFAFMASDGRPGSKPASAGETAISLSLGTDDLEEGKRVFAALAEGGKVTVPFGEVPWGGTFGMVDDRYGLSWMVSAR